MAADLNLIDMAALYNGPHVYDIPGGASHYTIAARGFVKIWVNGARVLEDDAYTPLNVGCGRII
jgi:N-acyl-D-aspartate/D-glutamate deacylase